MVESNSPDPGRAGFRGVMQSLAATLQSVTEDALGEVPNTTVSFTAEFPDDAPAQITGTVVVAFHDDAEAVPALLAHWFCLVERIQSAEAGTPIGPIGYEIGQFVFVVATHHRPPRPSRLRGMIPETFTLSVHASFGP